MANKKTARAATADAVKKFLDQTGATHLVSKVKELITSSIAGKADKSTTLEGYGITDAYTKAEVDTAVNAKANSADVYTKAAADAKIAAAVANADHLKRQRADALPEVASADADTIYMVAKPKANESDDDVYNEYLLITSTSAPVYNATENVPAAGGKFAASKVTVPEGKTIAVGDFVKDPRGNYNKVTELADSDGNLTVAAKEENAPTTTRFELIGSSAADLTGYATDQELTDAVSAAKTAAATDAQTKADAALAAAKTYADTKVADAAPTAITNEEIDAMFA